MHPFLVLLVTLLGAVFASIAAFVVIYGGLFPALFRWHSGWQGLERVYSITHDTPAYQGTLIRRTVHALRPGLIRGQRYALRLGSSKTHLWLAPSAWRLVKMAPLCIPWEDIQATRLGEHPDFAGPQILGTRWRLSVAGHGLLLSSETMQSLAKNAELPQGLLAVIGR